MAYNSLYRNPGQILPPDRELPELCANGTTVNAVGITASGTSLAAPAVSGIVALIQQTQPKALQYYPEATRAIMLAGARRNVDGGHWYNDLTDSIDGRDGVGAANAYASYRIALQRVDHEKFVGSTERGWDAFSLGEKIQNGEFESGFESNTVESVFSWSIYVTPNVGTSPLVPLKISCAWTRIPTLLPIDLDLVLYEDGSDQPVRYGNSYSNNYEDIYIGATPNRIYRFHVVVNNISNVINSIALDDTYVGVAWNTYPTTLHESG